MHFSFFLNTSETGRCVTKKMHFKTLANLLFYGDSVPLGHCPNLHISTATTSNLCRLTGAL